MLELSWNPVRAWVLWQTLVPPPEVVVSFYWTSDVVGCVSIMTDNELHLRHLREAIKKNMKISTLSKTPIIPPPTHTLIWYFLNICLSFSKDALWNVMNVHRNFHLIVHLLPLNIHIDIFMIFIPGVWLKGLTLLFEQKYPTLDCQNINVIASHSISGRLAGG